MFSKLLFILFLKMVFTTVNCDHNKINEFEPKTNNVVEITDENWDQMQRGQWFIGFFDKEAIESKKLDELWNNDFAQECKKANINVGRVFAPSNPALYIRFLVTVFPKVFYVKNGVAHEVPNASVETLVQLIKDEKLSKLKSVNFLSNPFSVQLSLLSHLFVHAVNLYNYEHSIVQKFVSTPSATDIAFGLTFIIVGTFLGLLMTCAFGLLQILLVDSKEPELKSEDKKESKDNEKTKEKEKESPEMADSVRKRK